MKLKDKILSSQAFLESLDSLSSEEAEFVQRDVSEFAEGLQDLIFTLKSKARTSEDSRNLYLALDEVLSARSEDG